jgi:hypothetical protein
MATSNQIVLDQMDQMADQLIAQLCSFKKAVADLRQKTAEVSTSAFDKKVLPDEQVAALLNKREQTIAKRLLKNQA